MLSGSLKFAACWNHLSSSKRLCLKFLAWGKMWVLGVSGNNCFQFWRAISIGALPLLPCLNNLSYVLTGCMPYQNGNITTMEMPEFQIQANLNLVQPFISSVNSFIFIWRVTIVSLWNFLLYIFKENHIIYKKWWQGDKGEREGGYN
jgi:hypothetical protein